MIGLACLLQIVKYSPLLDEALLDASANATLVERYTRWISVFGWTGAFVFGVGRLYVGSYANRWYYRQYSKWRIDDSVASGVDRQRIVTASIILALMVPITLYRATQQRLDERACFNQDRAIASTEVLFERFLSVIGKIPSIETEAAREAILNQLLAEPHDYIASCADVLKKAALPIEVKEIVTLGHSLRDYQRLVDKHNIDLLVVNTKQDDQLAMHGLAYPLCVELRDTPILML